MVTEFYFKTSLPRAVLGVITVPLVFICSIAKGEPDSLN